MNLIVAVNHVSEIRYRETTALLVAAFVRRGHQVSLAGVEDFAVDATHGENAISTAAYSARTITLPADNECSSESVEDFVKSNPTRVSTAMAAGDLILIRSNPGRDILRSAIHQAFLDICRNAKTNGIRVVNDPTHLQYFASKASVAAVDPRFRPPMILSNRVESIVDFIRRSQTDCVIKPLVGSRGNNVIRVSHAQQGLAALINGTFPSGIVVAQHFVETKQGGDKRVVIAGGKILEIDGQLAGIERRPSAGDFRANLHAGGTAHRLTLSPPERQAAEYAAGILHQHGIWLAGVDLIGDKIIEFNVFSTGGLFDAESYSAISFSDEIVDRLTR